MINPPTLESLPDFVDTLVQPLEPGYETQLRDDVDIRLPQRRGEIMRVTNIERFPALRLFQTNDGHIWFTTNSFLIEFDGVRFHTLGEGDGLPSAMNAMGEDSAGNLWIGGRTKLARLDRMGLITFDQRDGLKSADVQSINQANDGAIYLATVGFELNKWDGRSFHATHLPVSPNARSLWSSRYAVLSQSGEWWILTVGKLYRFSSSDLKTPIAVYTTADGLKSDEMFQVFEDSRGDIWLSQQPSKTEDFGLYRLEPGQSKFFPIFSCSNITMTFSAAIPIRAV